MTRTTDYDIEAADLVARSLRAVARDTDVAERPGEALPVACMPAPIPLGTHRHRRTRRTVAATAAAAAVLLAALVWAGRNPSNPSDPTTTGDTGPADQGSEELPPELVPGNTGAMATEPGAVFSSPARYFAQARILEPPAGGRILTAVVNWPDGQPADRAVLSNIVQTLTVVVGGDKDRAQITPTVGGSAGYLTLPLDDVDESVVLEVHNALVSDGVGVAEYGADDGWASLPADISWVPGVSPTVARHYSDGDVATVDLSSVAADIGPATAMVALLPDARPYPVGGGMGWQAPVPDGQTLFVWQAAPGTVGLIVASEAALADVGAMIESIPAPDPALGEHPNARLVGRSDEGSDVLWAVELADYLPSDGPPAVDEGPCMSLWVDGQVVGPTCGVEVPPPSAVVPFSVFGPVAHLDGDATVVFGLLSPAVTTVTIDPIYGVELSVDTQPVDPADPDGLRYVVMIVHGGRDVPQIFRFRAGNRELSTTEIDLSVVGG